MIVCREVTCCGGVSRPLNVTYFVHEHTAQPPGGTCVRRKQRGLRGRDMPRPTSALDGAVRHTSMKRCPIAVFFYGSGVSWNT